MKKLKHYNEKAWGKAKLVLSMWTIVFSLIYVSVSGLFIVYAIINKAPFLDIEKLPRHSSTYIFGVISLIIGILLSMIFRKHVLIPLQNSYIALGQVADGKFDVKINEKGIGPVRRVAKSINITAEELKNVESMRDDFINNFSHEFKTPIVSISGFAKILKHSELTEEEKNEYLDIIISESERLAQLSSNVLNLTRLDNQNIITGLTEFNVAEQIRRTIILLEHKWSDKNISIDFDSAEYNICANEELLNQLWINILDNAIKFSPEDSEIIVGVIKKDDSLIFTFADSGKGMDATTARHAFDRFYQGDVSHKSGGHGIGLAISKRICELHSGSIKIKSTDENGTVFEVILPIESYTNI